MLQSEASFLELFAKRNRHGAARQLWLDAGQTLLSDTLAAHHSDSDEAAQALASDWSPKGLRALAYVSTCFWYRPLWKDVQKSDAGRANYGTEPNSWKLAHLYASLQNEKNEATFSDSQILNQTDALLRSATTALKAVTLHETGYAALQETIFRKTLSKIAEDPFLARVAAAWPDANGPSVPLEKVKGLNPQKIAEHLSALLLQSAQEVPESLLANGTSVFSTMPRVTPRILIPGCGGGSFFYDKQTAAYDFNEQASFVFRTFLNFACGCLHETDHLLQCHLAMHKKKLALEDHALTHAACLFSDSQKIMMEKSNPDRPLNFFITVSDGQALDQAYRARPTEHFAYRTDAYPIVLHEKLGWSYAPTTRATFSHLIEIGRSHLSNKPFRGTALPQTRATTSSHNAP